MARLHVYVVPRSSQPGPDGRFDGLPRLRVRSAANDGRANAETERLLSELLRAPVKLARGARSRRKTFDIALETTVVERRLEEIFGD